MNFSISEISQLWDRVLQKVEIRLDDRNIFESFFEGSYIHEIKDDNIIVAVNSSLAAQLITQKYLDLLTDIVSEVTESNFKLSIHDKEDLKDGNKIKAEPKQENYFKESEIKLVNIGEYEIHNDNLDESKFFDESLLITKSLLDKYGVLFEERPNIKTDYLC